MTRICLVSGGDDRYFPLLLEWIHSVRRFPQGDGFDICILDAGLTDEQTALLRTGLAHNVVTPDWPGPLAARPPKGQDHLKACVARPFLPKLFPGYDLYIWMDADTWVQDWFAVEWLIAGAEKGALAICPQADRAYGKTMRLGWVGPIPWRPRSFYYSNGRKAFGGRIARSLFPYPTVNAGVFALRADAPHWARWQTLIVQALRKGKIFTAEQLTLGMLIYLDRMKTEFLPALCNWLCSTRPAWDVKTRMFVEPSVPHHPIGIMHLSGLDAIRLDRAIQTEFSTLGGGNTMASFRFPGYDGEKRTPLD